MTNVVLFGSQTFVGEAWPEEHSHRGPVRPLTPEEVAEIKKKVPSEARTPAVRYSFGGTGGFRRPAELFKHIDINTDFCVVAVDIFLLHRLAVAHLYSRPTGFKAARSVTEVRASTINEMRRTIQAAFPKLELPANQRSGRTKMFGFPVAEFAQVSAPTTRPSECRVRRCGEKAENPAFGGVLCTECRMNSLKVPISIQDVLGACDSPIVAAMTRPNWMAGLCGYPGIWFPPAKAEDAVVWEDCVRRGVFLHSGLALDEMAWIFTTRRPVDLSFCRVLVPDRTAVARISETETAIKLSLRLDRGPMKTIEICLNLRRYGVAVGPLLLNVDDQPDQARVGIGIHQLRERNPTLQAGGLTLMTLPDKTPVVIMTHAAAALARLLNKDQRGIPISYSVHEGQKPPRVPEGAIEIDAEVGIQSMRLFERVNSDTVFYVTNAQALTFGLLYYLVQTPASIIFSGSKLGKYGFTHKFFKSELGQAWYCVVRAAADPDSNGTLVTTGEIDYVDASFRSMLTAAQAGPCSVCEVDHEGRDHITDLLLWANTGTVPKWQCAAPAVFRGRSLEQAESDAREFYKLLKSAISRTFA